MAEQSSNSQQPSVEPPKALYSSVVSGIAPPKASNVQLSSYKGEPAVIIPSDTEVAMAAKFQRALVGKFSQGRPPLETIKKFLSVQNYKGNFSYGLLDNKHIIFRFQQDEDYIRLFSKPSWQVGNKNMRIFKWTVDFHVDKEPSIMPIWFSLPKLPIHLINQDFIFRLMESIGKPLRLDAATAELRRPSLSRVQVEIDVLRHVPHRIWIQKENGDGFWQVVSPEGTRPAYCTHCWHMGHWETNCMVKNPHLVTSKAPDGNTTQPSALSGPSKASKVYVVKTRPSNDAPIDKNSGKSITLEVPSMNPGKLSVQEPSKKPEKPIVIQDPSNKPERVVNIQEPSKSTLSANYEHNMNDAPSSVNPTLNDLVSIHPSNKQGRPSIIMERTKNADENVEVDKHWKHNGSSSDTETNRARVANAPLWFESEDGDERSEDGDEHNEDIQPVALPSDTSEPNNAEGFTTVARGRKKKNQTTSTIIKRASTRSTKSPDRWSPDG